MKSIVILHMGGKFIAKVTRTLAEVREALATRGATILKVEGNGCGNFVDVREGK